MSVMSEMEQAHRQDAQQEAALGRLLEAFRLAKLIYTEQGASYPARLLKAEKLIADERDFLQAVWN